MSELSKGRGLHARGPDIGGCGLEEQREREPPGRELACISV